MLIDDRLAYQIALEWTELPTSSSFNIFCPPPLQEDTGETREEIGSQGSLLDESQASNKVSNSILLSLNLVTLDISNNHLDEKDTSSRSQTCLRMTWS